MSDVKCTFFTYSLARNKSQGGKIIAAKDKVFLDYVWRSNSKAN